MLHNIAQEFERSKDVQWKVGGVAFFSSAHKDDREWQVLGATCKLMTRTSGISPAFAMKSEAPDFMIYSSEKTRLGGVEIVEVLRPGYRRHDFYKERALPDAPEFFEPDGPLDDPWSPLRTQIGKKVEKCYPEKVTLLVYYDIGRLSLSDWGTPFHDQLLREHERTPFAGIDAFKEVLVLFSDMECLVQLYPTAHTIVPDANE